MIRAIEWFDSKLLDCSDWLVDQAWGWFDLSRDELAKMFLWIWIVCFFGLLFLVPPKNWVDWVAEGLFLFFVTILMIFRVRIVIEYQGDNLAAILRFIWVATSALLIWADLKDPHFVFLLNLVQNICWVGYLYVISSDDSDDPPGGKRKKFFAEIKSSTEPLPQLEGQRTS